MEIHAIILTRDYLTVVTVGKGLLPLLLQILKEATILYANENEIPIQN